MLARVQRNAQNLAPEQRVEWIRTAAYFIAEANNFGGDPMQHWLQAEQKLSAAQN